VKLYNTLTRRKEPVQPIHRGWVGLYTCGPTVYNYAHIGNLRTFVLYDLLKRTLEYHGYKTKHVLNITDVGHFTHDADEGEDKMQLGALREKKTPWELAKFYTEAYLQDAALLNIIPPWTMPKATEHIAEDIALITTLEKKGFTYDTPGVVYFDTAKFPNYGALVGKKGIEGLKAGARVERDPNKRNPTDFALWFRRVGKHETHAMHWPSPWGDGFPGWHIECSAMSQKYLGIPFDVHAGGIDHIPIHHTNEIAQTEAATGKPMAQVWMHGAFMTIRNNRMGKSEGNFITLATVQEKEFDPLALRYLFLLTHYRKGLNFSWPALKSASTAYGKLRSRIQELRQPVIARSQTTKQSQEDRWEKRFTSALTNDLDIPTALATLWTLLKSKEPAELKYTLATRWDAVFGLNLETPRAQEKIPAAVKKLLADRQAARAAKNWKLADDLRKKIEAQGFTVKDTSEGPKVTSS